MDSGRDVLSLNVVYRYYVQYKFTIDVYYGFIALAINPQNEVSG